jgi:hypothetical protein
MKRSTYCMTTAAAVLMMTAGVASAQTELRAEVPFAFHVSGKVMEPGKIQVKLHSPLHNAMALIVSNFDAGHSYIVLPQSTGDAPRKWVEGGLPRLGFDCSTGACILAKVWTGQGAAYTFYYPKTRGGEMLLTEIVLTPGKAD